MFYREIMDKVLAFILICACVGVDYVLTYPEYSDPSKELPVIGLGEIKCKYSGLGSLSSTRSVRQVRSESCAVPPTECSSSKYRSYDGSCNNLENPGWGMPDTPYGKLLPINYADGISKLPVSSTGDDLPNVREISTAAFPDKLVEDPKWNLNAQQWGQFVAHDMSLTASGVSADGEPAVCCSNGQFGPDATTNPICAPIHVPANDSFHAPYGTQCLNFVRTGSTRDRKCTPEDSAAIPVSVVTAYMDLSLVYGNTESEIQKLRSFQGGKMLTDFRGGQEWPPQEASPTKACAGAESDNEPCYMTGDSRMNQSPHLAILHILMLREHNRLADELAEINPGWSDEKVFQEARRINIAQNQHINYYEYLPIFLGYNNMVRNRLIYPDAEGYVNDYNSNVDPSVSDEHATAAFRHFHTLIRGYLHLMKEDRKLAAYTRLSDWFDRPIMLEVSNFFDELTMGFTAQPQSASDQFWDSETINYLFRHSKAVGTDLRALDIQRGRDHGLGTYTEARAICGLPVPRTFDDMKEYISEENVEVLAVLYKDVKDIDLVVGGSLENNVPGTEAGPTYLCLLTEQFYRTRVGDRYFYENGDSEIAFTPSQLQSIRKGASMARILCDNTRIQNMQQQAFELINDGNPLLPCNSLPAIDLKLWKEES
ncbi:unnamed protein product [Pieris brassicae]|uniref:Peroxidase n=1 Tax=Pieris brassicae TaxID=7116 RepID=A0A9P0XBG6_PIEBR|nr:unnamed protein product [Pieris brassicae]